MNFRVFNFPVTIEPMFWIVSLLFGLMAGLSPVFLLLLIAAMFIGVLVHELGHAFTARRYGGRETSILLHGFGGTTTWHPSRRLTWKESFLVAVSGPFLGFVPGLIAFVVLSLFSRESLGPALVFFLKVVYLISIIWGLINLVPLRPMDGFQALGSLLSRKRSHPPAWLEGVSVASGILLVLAALHFRYFFAAILFGYFTWLSFRQMRHD
ncbi:MAG: hypothetical protein RL095_130 [Verrucomicrobiota bacterium]